MSFEEALIIIHSCSPHNRFIAAAAGAAVGTQVSVAKKNSPGQFITSNSASEGFSSSFRG